MDGKVEVIHDQDLVQRIRGVARAVNVRALVLAAALTAVVALCPA